MPNALAGGVAAALILAVAGLFLAPHARAGDGFCGLASWYAYTGHRTATGEPFDGRGFTAASRTLPFGTRLRVTYGARSVVVRVNDRGPYVVGRVLDLSRAAAEALGMLPAGVGRVCAEALPR